MSIAHQPIGSRTIVLQPTVFFGNAERALTPSRLPRFPFGLLYVLPHSGSARFLRVSPRGF